MNQDQAPNTPEPTPQPTPVATAAPVTANPGHTLGIVSLILSIVGFGPVGIILGAIGLKKSKTAGQKNGLALAGLIVGSITTVLAIVIIVGLTMAAAARYSEFLQQCKDIIPGSNPTVVAVNGELKCSYSAAQ